MHRQTHPAVQPHAAAGFVDGHRLRHEAAAEERRDAILDATGSQPVQRAAAGR